VYKSYKSYKSYQSRRSQLRAPSGNRWHSTLTNPPGNYPAQMLQKVPYVSELAETSDVLIIGGGLIGLSIAWHLADYGMQALVLERNTVGSGASGAATGLLTPVTASGRFGHMVDFGIESLRGYTEFLNILREESQQEIALQTAGLLRVALDKGAESMLSQFDTWPHATALEMVRLSASEALSIAPYLSPEVRGAVISPLERQINPRTLLACLRKSCLKRGVKIVEHAQVLSIADAHGSSGKRAIRVRSEKSDYGFGSLVVASGAWSAEMGQMLECPLPVTPTRGQVVTALPGTVPHNMQHTVYANHAYIIPGEDNALMLGSTSVRSGFDTRPTLKGITDIVASTAQMMPGILDAEFQHTWCGLRPTTPDYFPILGRLPQWDNVFAATGHYKNGVLLTPITGRVMASEIAGGDVSPLITHYRPERFCGGSTTQSAP
jgi:glycine oxidase